MQSDRNTHTEDNMTHPIRGAIKGTTDLISLSPLPYTVWTQITCQHGGTHLIC